MTPLVIAAVLSLVAANSHAAPSRVGNRGAGAIALIAGNTERYQNTEDFHMPEIPTLGWVLISMSGVASSILIAAVCFCVCKKYKLCQKSDDKANEERVNCYLCSKKVRISSWNGGGEEGKGKSHRKKCALKHKALLDSLECISPQLRCPHCKRRLRQWPADLGPPFRCRSRNCAVIGEIMSNGTNRFNCFACDYDICDSCARRRINTKRTSSSSSSRSLPPLPRDVTSVTSSHRRTSSKRSVKTTNSNEEKEQLLTVPLNELGAESSSTDDVSLNVSHRRSSSKRVKNPSSNELSVPSESGGGGDIKDSESSHHHRKGSNRRNKTSEGKDEKGRLLSLPAAPPKPPNNESRPRRSASKKEKSHSVIPPAAAD